MWSVIFEGSESTKCITFVTSVLKATICVQFDKHGAGIAYSDVKNVKVKGFNWIFKNFQIYFSFTLITKNFGHMLEKLLIYNRKLGWWKIPDILISDKYTFVQNKNIRNVVINLLLCKTAVWSLDYISVFSRSELQFAKVMSRCSKHF